MSSVVGKEQARVLQEHLVEQEVVVPKRVVREELFEKVMVVPERRFVEDIIEETFMVREKIIEVEKPTVVETLIEEPKVEFVEKTVSFDSTRHEERIKQVPRVRMEEEVVEVPKVYKVEKIVEVPEIEYRDILIEKIVEVPEYHDEVVVKEVPDDEYVEVPVYQDKLVEVEKDYLRRIPVPVELESQWKFRMPSLKSKHRVQPLHIYVPRFIEVPVPTACLSDEEVNTAHEIHGILKNVARNPAPTLSDLEKLAELAKLNESLIRPSGTEIADAAISQKLQNTIRRSVTPSTSSTTVGGTSTLCMTPQTSSISCA